MFSGIARYVCQPAATATATATAIAPRPEQQHFRLTLHLDSSAAAASNTTTPNTTSSSSSSDHHPHHDNSAFLRSGVEATHAMLEQGATKAVTRSSSSSRTSTSSLPSTTTIPSTTTSIPTTFEAICGHDPKLQRLLTRYLRRVPCSRTARRGIDLDTLLRRDHHNMTLASFVMLSTVNRKILLLDSLKRADADLQLKLPAAPQQQQQLLRPPSACSPSPSPSASASPRRRSSPRSSSFSSWMDIDVVDDVDTVVGGDMINNNNSTKNRNKNQRKMMNKTDGTTTTTTTTTTTPTAAAAKPAPALSPAEREELLVQRGREILLQLHKKTPTTTMPHITHN